MFQTVVVFKDGTKATFIDLKSIVDLSVSLEERKWLPFYDIASNSLNCVNSAEVRAIVITYDEGADVPIGPLPTDRFSNAEEV